MLIAFIYWAGGSRPSADRAGSTGRRSEALGINLAAHYIKMATYRILAVDDEKNFLTLLTRTLQKVGYEVRTALDGREALKRLEEEPFHLALIDIRMEPMGGLSLLCKIRTRYPITKTIMITAYPTPETHMKSFQKGTFAYLVKPVDLNVLKDTIRSVLSC